VQPDTPDADRERTLTLEAFADTIIPGEKRSPDDRAVAGAASGGGAVTAGALTLLHEPASGVVGALDNLVPALNAHAQAYAAEHGLVLDTSVPTFVALPFADRTALVQTLVAPDHPEKEMWIAIALFSTMAFDIAAHLHTTDALTAGHPGLATTRFTAPDPDGRWRFPAFSYGRKLADPHPDTTASGSPR
jgi:enediyne biosynthesis protein E8